jgi:hypothetical protein
MIHFFPPHVDKIRARIPQMAREVDVLCGNLEDAIPADAKEAARAGFLDVARNADLGPAALWTRVNAEDRRFTGNYLYGAFGRDFKTSGGRLVYVVAITRRQWPALGEATGLAAGLAQIEPLLDVDLSR